MDVTRLNITQEVLTWIESGSALSTIVQQPTDYLCNGDTMFHVNKGVIGFKMDGAQNVTMKNTSVDEIENFGTAGSGCAATTASPIRARPSRATVARWCVAFPSRAQVRLRNCHASNLSAVAGTVVGFDILTDTRNVNIKKCSVKDVDAGNFFATGGPNEVPDAIGVLIGAGATKVSSLKSTFNFPRGRMSMRSGT